MSCTVNKFVFITNFYFAECRLHDQVVYFAKPKNFWILSYLTQKFDSFFLQKAFKLKKHCDLNQKPGNPHLLVVDLFIYWRRISFGLVPANPSRNGWTLIFLVRILILECPNFLVICIMTHLPFWQSEVGSLSQSPLMAEGIFLIVKILFQVPSLFNNSLKKKKYLVTCDELYVLDTTSITCTKRRYRPKGALAN